MPNPRVPAKDWHGWALLDEARSTYRTTVSPHYDEVLDEATERFQRAGSLGKADIGALLLWKRLRADTPWAAKLNATSDSEVRAKTGAAFEAVNDQSQSRAQAAGDGRRALLGLPGFNHGAALASAVLLAAAPKRMAVYDRRVQRALDDHLRLAVDKSAGFYQGYLQLVDDLIAGQASRKIAWTARDVDVALFQLGSRAPRTPHE